MKYKTETRWVYRQEPKGGIADAVPRDGGKKRNALKSRADLVADVGIMMDVGRWQEAYKLATKYGFERLAAQCKRKL